MKVLPYIINTIINMIIAIFSFSYIMLFLNNKNYFFVIFILLAIIFINIFLFIVLNLFNNKNQKIRKKMFFLLTGISIFGTWLIFLIYITI